MKMKCAWTLVLCLILSGFPALGQTETENNVFNPETNLSGVPFLTITPDARGGGMGDVGAATEPDVNSQFWNLSKYAFSDSKAGIAINYTPWLRKLVNDIDLVNVTGFYKLGNDDNQALSASLRYFSLGEIMIIKSRDDPGYAIKPSEFSLDLAYSRQLSRHFSMGIGLRYIFSDLTVESEETPANAFAADIAAYYRLTVPVGNYDGLLGLGLNLSNIGTKVSYDGGATNLFLPAMMRLGGSFLFPMDEYNTISINADASKPLTPTPPVRADGESDDAFRQRMNEKREMSSIAAIFSSFSDAPGGFKEELQEVRWSVGLEYVYNKQFAVRGGYYNESQYKGNRKYFSVGAGFKLHMFSLDAAYLISVAQASPLDQTLRFSLAFNLDGLKSLIK